MRTFVEAVTSLEQNIAEGCREMADIYLEIQREFEPLDAETSHAYDSMQEIDQALKVAAGLR